MIYRAIGAMSGSSLDGLDIAFVEFQENAGQWVYEIKEVDCYPYNQQWVGKLKTATTLSTVDYQLLNVEYGHYIGQQINKFIQDKNLNYQVALISSHGHTSFHVPSKNMTAQLGDGAAIAAATRLPVVTDLRAMDVALGGQGAPIVPIGEKFLLGGYNYFLNLGGIANISFKAQTYVAFDVCAANRVLNMVAANAGKEYDQGGEMARQGAINEQLLNRLNNLDYYNHAFPKSLANDFGTDIVYPMIRDSGDEVSNALRTYVEHIVFQIAEAVKNVQRSIPIVVGTDVKSSMLVTGGGAFNHFLIERLKAHVKKLNVEVVVPDQNLIKYKEAMIMAFIGVLRWRQEYNVLCSVTGASRDSIGGALWIGQEA
ncbi:MAG TPA: anhydro-N-acetylmuramic acid kinase [Chitinophagaceae bacterium]|nr:anhydro-N-acetylmuramic acid kinase [Chitinophagaceae bacterium]